MQIRSLVLGILLLVSITPYHISSSIDDDTFQDNISLSNTSLRYNLPAEISDTTDSIESIHAIIGLDKLHAMQYFGQDVTVAVIDTGVKSTHEVFEHTNILYQKSFVTKNNGYPDDENAVDVHGHGTGTSSIVLGNSTTYTGAAPAANLVNAKIYGGGVITSKGLIAALDWVSSLSEVDIISISLSEPEEGITEDDLEEAVRIAESRGKIIFNSAGNLGKSATSINYFTIGSPSASPQTITIGATSTATTMAYYSSNGPTTGWEAKPDLVAPGTDIEMASLTGYRDNDGTSFSTPLVAGATAALLSALRANGIDDNPGMVKALLGLGAKDLGYNWAMQGNGLVNVSRSLELALEQRNEYNLAFPSTIPFIKRKVLPAGEQLDTKITLSSSIIGSWSIQEISENLQAIVLSDPIQVEFQDHYSQVMTLRLAPSLNTPSGDIMGWIDLIGPGGIVQRVNVDLSITAPARARMLIDLAHTPWDSIYSSSHARLERIFGQDLTPILTQLDQQNIFYTEFLTGDLTPELLEYYDILWMPSAFSVPDTYYIDHDINRDTLLRPHELFSIQTFIQKGGHLILDIEGVSNYEGDYGPVITDTASALSILNMLGVSLTSLSDDVSTDTANAVNSSSLFNNISSITSLSGSNALESGFSIMENVNGDPAQIGMYGPSGSRVFISNTRNWRTSGQPSEYLSQIISWLIAEDEIQSIDYSQGDGSTIFSVTIEGITPSDFDIQVYDEEQSYNIINLSFENESVIVETTKISNKRVTLDLSFGTAYLTYNMYIDDLDAYINFDDHEIDVEELYQALHEGFVTWKVDVKDYEPFFKYQVYTEIEGIFSSFVDWSFTKSTQVQNMGYLQYSLSPTLLQSYDKDQLMDLVNQSVFAATIYISQAMGRIIEYQINIKLIGDSTINTSLNETDTTSFIVQTSDTSLNLYLTNFALLIIVWKRKKH
ncbi:MAG: S8 family serine peptidase [Candidatus Heimdallarchaeota archaeon]|nr:S8 family serine peptidase [Candidatus Heimdallarchaeota archaeon]